MDSVKIGKVILELRKHAKLTQAQLAEKLCVSDKAVSKWELGASIPDIQQLESITQIFNISYDILLTGDVDRVKLYLVQQDANSHSEIGNRVVSSREWYKLDNAAKVYPSQNRPDWNLVFRVSAVMKEEIDEKILQSALEDMMNRFPTFMVTLKKGLFWYYFERMEKKPIIEHGDRHPCEKIPLNGKKYLFRVLVDKNRISCEFFHSLTDGTGAIIFTASLLTRYYELKYGQIKDYKGVLNVLDSVQPEEIEDSFERYATKDIYSKRVVKNAYHLSEKRVRNNIVTHVVVDTAQLKELAKKYNTTITVFLAAVFTKAFLTTRLYDKSNLPYILQIPVNLRSRFASKTLRNFSSYTEVEIKEEELSIEELIVACKNQIALGIELDKLRGNINSNIRDERNPFIRLAPLTLKDAVLRIAASLLGDKSYTTVFSNIGEVNAPDELKRIVDRFEVVMKDDKLGGVSMSAISFNGKCNITFTRSVLKSTIERDFARCLSNMGLKLYVEGNGGDR